MRYRVATQDDLAELTAVIATAFRADPVWGPYSFPDDERRLAQSSAVWSAFLAAVLRFGWTFVTPGCEAAAVWVPPGETELLPEHERELESIAERQLGAGQAAIMFDAFERLESAHPHDPPHYYLSLLGTHADHRGNGIGMKLLTATLEAVDRERMPAYLESTNPANDARYMRVGFQPYGRLALPNGHIITTMWRPPARPPARAVALTRVLRREPGVGRVLQLAGDFQSGNPACRPSCGSAKCSASAATWRQNRCWTCWHSWLIPTAT